MTAALLQLCAIVAGLGLIGALCAGLAQFLDGLDRVREMREAAQREAEELRAVRARMHGWVPR